MWIKILSQQKYPVRFLFSRILRDSGLWRLVRIQRNGYQLKLHPDSLALSLWVDSNDRKGDSLILKKLLRKDDHFYDVGANIGHLCIEGALAVGQNLVYGRALIIFTAPLGLTWWFVYKLRYRD